VALCAGLIGLVVLAVWLVHGRSGIHSAIRESVSSKTPCYVPPSVDDYVGSEMCATCHSEIAEAFRSHPMSRSLRRVDEETIAGLPQGEQSRVSGKQRILEVEVPDGAMAHHEKMYDAAGELIYDQSVPMDYVVGSGRRAMAYLHQRGNLLFMSPLNWYARTQRWDLAPGYRPDDPRRFDRRVTDECLGCHAGRVAPEGRSLNAYRRPAFAELSIGCENCHGPGRRHVARHEVDSTARGEADTIVNPARLDPARREAVCNQCHLQAAARIPRYGRNDLDFRPGQNLEEIWTVLDAGSGVTDDGRTRSVSHVQQMRASRCYAESGGRLGCISCHDPHRLPPESERAAFYRERCLACHREASCSLPARQRFAADDSCITCHMPDRKASNITHVTQTDHRVIRRPGAPVEEEGAGDSLAFFDRADRRLEAWERDRALGLAAWKHLSKTGRQRPTELIPLLARVLDIAPADGTVLRALGSIAADNQLIDRARAFYERARQVPETEEAALSGLLDIYYLTAQRDQALACSDRLIALDPGDARVYALRADLLSTLGRESEGIAAARRALELDPTLVSVREWLAEACRKAGRVDEQREQKRFVERMQGARPPRR
jgi:hypothetical protein